MFTRKLSFDNEFPLLVSLNVLLYKVLKCMPTLVIRNRALALLLGLATYFSGSYPGEFSKFGQTPLLRN